MFDLPEKAIRCFEKWSGTVVTVHRYSNVYKLMIDMDRAIHQHGSCHRAKSTADGKFCEPVDQFLPVGEKIIH